MRVGLVHTPQTLPQPVETYPGFGLEQADPLVGDDLSRVVTWKGNDNVARLSDTLAIRIEMSRATLFSFTL